MPQAGNSGRKPGSDVGSPTTPRYRQHRSTQFWAPLTARHQTAVTVQSGGSMPLVPTDAQLLNVTDLGRL